MTPIPVAVASSLEGNQMAAKKGGTERINTCQKNSKFCTKAKESLNSQTRSLLDQISQTVVMSCFFSKGPRQPPDTLELVDQLYAFTMVRWENI